MLNSARGTSRAQRRSAGAALTEQIGVVQFVDRVFQVQPAQERIRRDLRGAQDVAPAVTLNFGERDQLAHTPVKITPYPSVNRPQHPVNPRSLLRHRDYPLV